MHINKTQEYMSLEDYPKSGGYPNSGGYRKRKYSYWGYPKSWGYPPLAIVLPKLKNALSCTYSPLPPSELAPLTEENVFSVVPLFSEEAAAAAAGFAEEAGAEEGTTPSTAGVVVWWWPSKLT